MKNLLYVIFLLLSSCTSKVPWGMIEVEKEVGVCDTEITVGEWLEFIYSSENKGDKIFDIKYLPDNTIVKQLPYAKFFELDSEKKFIKHLLEFLSMLIYLFH